MRLEAVQIANQVPPLKTLYICEFEGCGWVSERKSKYCADHARASQRAECRKEFTAISKKSHTGSGSRRIDQLTSRPEAIDRRQATLTGAKRGARSIAMPPLPPTQS